MSNTLGHRAPIVEPIDAKRLKAARALAEALRKRGVEVQVDERELCVRILPKPEQDVAMLLRYRDMARAVALGISPESAVQLENEDYVLIVIDLKDYVKPNHLRRVKGRIIGRSGTTRRTVEQLAGVTMAIGERHVAIVGKLQNAEVAKTAVEMLIAGSKHNTVYRYIQRALENL